MRNTYLQLLAMQLFFDFEINGALCVEGHFLLRAIMMAEVVVWLTTTKHGGCSHTVHGTCTTVVVINSTVPTDSKLASSQQTKHAGAARSTAITL